MNVLCKDHLPLIDVVGKSFLYSDCLQLQGTNLMGRLYFFNRVIHYVKVFNLFLKVFEFWLGCTESLQVILRFLGPQP
jgi:hypothetical protein